MSISRPKYSPYLDGNDVHVAAQPSLLVPEDTYVHQDYRGDPPSPFQLDEDGPPNHTVASIPSTPTIFSPLETFLWTSQAHETRPQSIYPGPDEVEVETVAHRGPRSNAPRRFNEAIAGRADVATVSRWHMVERVSKAIGGNQQQAFRSFAIQTFLRREEDLDHERLAYDIYASESASTEWESCSPPSQSDSPPNSNDTSSPSSDTSISIKSDDLDLSMSHVEKFSSLSNALEEAGMGSMNLRLRP